MKEKGRFELQYNLILVFYSLLTIKIVILGIAYMKYNILLCIN